MKTTKRAWWTPYKYAAPSDWEHFMEDMAAQGWNVDKIRQSSSFCMVFRKTEPKRYRYVMDLNAFPKKDYTATFEAFGWELVGKMASEYIWRKEYEGERPEAFSSEESRIKRSMNIINVLRILLLLMLAGAGIVTAVRIAAPQYFNRPEEYAAPVVIFGAMAVFFGIFIGKIYRNREY